MAGSRIEKFGTVYTRIRDLMRSGVLKKADRPIWYDVYEAFPPKREPLYVKQYTRIFTTKQDAVPDIFYKEDEIRAKFFEQYAEGPRALDLTNSKFVSTSQRFVDKYMELKSQGELDDSALFKATGKALLAEGIMLKGKGAPSVSAASKHPVLQLNLRNIVEEQQADGTSSEETAERNTTTS